MATLNQLPTFSVRHSVNHNMVYVVFKNLNKLLKNWQNMTFVRHIPTKKRTSYLDMSMLDLVTKQRLIWNYVLVFIDL